MSLVVYSKGMRVGILDMADSESFYGFTYDSSFLASNDAVQLSLSLPLQTGRFSGSRSLPFFEGLLPEGDVRASIARQLGVSERSPAKLLHALGRDFAGDVAVLEEDDPYQPPSNDAYSLLEDGLSHIARNPFGEISRLRALNRHSLAGGQEKIALYHDRRRNMASGWYVPLEGSPSTHIIKPQVEDAYPQLVYNEFLCMRLAGVVGLDVARTDILMLDRPLLIIERCDRVPSGEINAEGLTVYERTRQEDFCQALGCDSSRKYELDGGPGIASMSDLLLTRSAQALKDREALLRLVLFNYLIGNCDAHAKNYSVLLGQNGAVRLAPAYDLLSTAVYDGVFGTRLSRGMGMKIGEHSNIDRVSHDDFELLARTVNVSAGSLIRMADELSSVLVAGMEAVEAELRDLVEDDVSELTMRIRSGIEQRASVIADCK